MSCFSKISFHVFAVPNEKTSRLARLLAEVGMPETRLSNRGTNLLSFFTKDACELLGVLRCTQPPTIPSE